MGARSTIKSGRIWVGDKRQLTNQPDRISYNEAGLSPLSGQFQREAKLRGCQMAEVRNSRSTGAASVLSIYRRRGAVYPVSAWAHTCVCSYTSPRRGPPQTTQMQVWVAQGAPKLAQQEQCTNAALAVGHGLFLSLRMDSATFHCQVGPEAPLIPHLTLPPTPPTPAEMPSAGRKDGGASCQLSPREQHIKSELFLALLSSI